MDRDQHTKRNTKATEGAAVFIGRASFRMVPSGREDAIPNPNSGVGTDQLFEPSVSNIPADVEWFNTSEKVVLTPPDSVALTRAAGDLDPAANDVDFIPRATARRAIPMWAVAVALIAGATITLSAQAVMRRPVVRVAAEAEPSAVTVPAATTASTGITSPGTAAASAATTVVVPSTVFWAVKGESTLAGHAAHNDRGLPHPTGVAIARGHAKPAPWVDPFVAAEARPAVPRKVSANPRHAKMAASTTWVDPFVQ